MRITIDGPAGSGKSTAARKLAKALGIAYLDTGATYRAVTLAALRAGIDLADADALERIARHVDIRLLPEPDGARVLLDGEDVSSEIRSERVSENSHWIAEAPAVREVLVTLQRRIADELGDVVSEGRDQGSVVFPDAEMKFFLIASPEIRARRRVEQLLAQGESADYDGVLAGIARRDGRDSTRPVAPLVEPKGAVRIDTSGNTIDETAEVIRRRVEAMR